MATIYELATELSEALTRDTRTNGDTFVKLADGSPKWMTEVIHKAHGDAMPDDQIYRFCEMAADAIAAADEDGDEETFRDAIMEIEPPCYTHEQMKWFAGNWEYCDQAISEGLWASDGRGHGCYDFSQVTDLVAIGMQLHIQEVGNALLAALVEEVEAREAA